MKWPNIDKYMAILASINSLHSELFSAILSNKVTNPQTTINNKLQNKNISWTLLKLNTINEQYLLKGQWATLWKQKNWKMISILQYARTLKVHNIDASVIQAKNWNILVAPELLSSIGNQGSKDYLTVISQSTDSKKLWQVLEMLLTHLWSHFQNMICTYQRVPFIANVRIWCKFGPWELLSGWEPY